VKLIFTCEHGGNIIPSEYLKYFNNAQSPLNSHRGLDYGAIDLFNYCKELSDYSKSNSVSRLLIELNRSINNPKLFSEFSKILKPSEKEKLINEIYLPYRNEVENVINAEIKEGEEVVHISFHSFTPELDGKHRNTDIGLLYDPSRTSEKKISKNLKQLLKEELPKLKVRYNYPYLGKADGFTTALRKKFPNHYSGIELEINQKYSSNNSMNSNLKKSFYNSLSLLELKNNKPLN